MRDPMKIALILSEEGKCSRRGVGCVLIDTTGYVAATGYNGPPAGMADCSEDLCAGIMSSPGTNLEGCSAIHAEQNALIQCRDSQNLAEAYVTTEPCMHCLKMLANTSLKLLVYKEEYPDSEVNKKFWWENSAPGRAYIKYGEEQ